MAFRNAVPGARSAVATLSSAPLPPRRGVHRAPTAGDDTLDDNLKALDRLFEELQAITATGFDRGRAIPGLDRLADTVAATRFSQRDKTGAGDFDTTDRMADKPDVQQLHDSVIDLAARMQFLAINLHLVGETLSDDGRKFKITLETVANTLLVLTEDQRRQRDHRADQRQAAEGERNAVVAGFTVDLERRYTQLTDWVQTRALAAGLAEKSVADLVSTDSLVQASLDKLNGDFAKVQARARTSADKATQLSALFVTVNGKKSEERSAPANMIRVRDEATAWKTDADTVKALFDKAPAVLSTLALRKQLETWLKTQIAELNSPARAADLRLERLKAAQSGLSLLKAKTVVKQEQARAETLKLVLDDLAAALQAALNTAVTDQADLLKVKVAADGEKARRAAAKGKLDKAIAANPETFERADLDRVRTLLLAEREAVLRGATARLASADPASLINALTARLKERAETPSAKAAAEQALAVVGAWSPIPALTLNFGDRKKDRHADAKDILDRLEAHLIYQQMEAVRTNGKGSATAQQAGHALELLTQRRARMAYLRPASMYLRSSLASAMQQSDPGLDWRNLLTENFKRALGAFPGSEQSTTVEVRAALDKAFWQNVNRVRLSGAGDSNFAIAKDDVGNWYVKSMGTDSAAMVRAAKNLALFNIGSGMGSNLLRIDELRTSMGKSKRDSAEYISDKTELDKLTDGGNSPAASAYGNTLQVFEANYTQATTELLAALSTELKAKNLLLALETRWAKRYDSAPRSILVKDLVNTNADVLALHDKAFKATTEPPDTTKAAARVIGSLQALVQLRSKLKALLATGKLTENEDSNASTSAKATSDAQKDVLAAQGLQATLLNALADAEKQRDTAVNDSAARTAAEAAVRSAQTAVVNKGKDLTRLLKFAADKQATHAAALAVQTAAKSVQAQAQGDVDEVLGKTITDAAQKQLRYTEEFETAARVVSQGLATSTAAKK